VRLKLRRAFLNNSMPFRAVLIISPSAGASHAHTSQSMGRRAGGRALTWCRHFFLCGQPGHGLLGEPE